LLTSAYGLTRSQLEQALEALLRTKELVVDRADQVLQALRIFKATKADLADCLIERSAAGVGCEQTMTFDVGAAKGAGMILIQ
jgi:predicted nucleic-acid-binding protein